MRVWLDDLRPMPQDFDIHVKSSQAAIDLLKTGQVTLISLDHDLGEHAADYDTGYLVALFIEKGAYEGTLAKLEWRIHSANPVGSRRMREALQQAEEYWLK